MSVEDAAQIFLSTPSARRATFAAEGAHRRPQISIHALREEGDILGDGGMFAKVEISIHALREEGDGQVCAVPDRHVISIHALREEGDYIQAFNEMEKKLFLSTPSARRATCK